MARQAIDAGKQPGACQRRWAPRRVIPVLAAALLLLAQAACAGGRPPIAASSHAHAGVAPPETSSPAQRQPTVTVAAVGDILMGTPPQLPPDDGATLFTEVAPKLGGDVVLANLDTALTTSPTSIKCAPDAADCYAFRAPPRYARWLADAGFTVLNLANNHTHDYGRAGLLDTAEALKAHGLHPTGLPGQIALQHLDGGVSVASVGFAPYAWSQSLIDIPAAKRLVREADKRADLVVVSMHAGGEGPDRRHVRPGTEYFLGENRGDPIAFSHAVIDAGADLVIGTGPHVLRGMQWYQGRLIAYSMGSFTGYEVLDTSGVLGVAGILEVTLRRDGTFVHGHLTGTRMEGNGLPVLDPQNRAADIVRRLSRTDFPTCGLHLAASGLLSPPTC